MELRYTIEGNPNVHLSDSFVLQKGINRIHETVTQCTLNKCTFEMDYPISDDVRIFMNGYQTWTVCNEYTKDSKIRGLHGLPSFLVNQYALDRYGDYHFVDYPNQKGITHGFTWCYFRYGNQYTFFGSLNEETGYTEFLYDANTEHLTITKDNEGLKVNGEFPFLDLYYAQGTEEEVFDGWFQALGIQPKTKEKVFGYSSWYNRYQDINEICIQEDFLGCKKILSKNDMFQIDDGWEPFIGDWLETDKEKFPHGLKPIVEKIHQDGYRTGLWLAPFVAEEKSSLYQNHKDWFLKVNGEPWKAGCNWSGFYALDLDCVEVQNYLREVFDRVLNEWNFDFVKLDFLYAVAPFGNEKETRAGRMIRAMKFLRELVGEKQILGCGVPVMPAFGLVDYCRISCDVSLDEDDKLYMRILHRERVSTRHAIQNIVSRRELNGRAYGSDSDVFFLRKDNISLTKDQKLQLAELDALFSNVFFTSDNPSKYDDEMLTQYKTIRYIAENATDIQITYGPTMHISYTLDGIRKELKLDGYTGLFE